MPKVEAMEVVVEKEEMKGEEEVMEEEAREEAEQEEEDRYTPNNRTLSNRCCSKDRTNRCLHFRYRLPRYRHSESHLPYDRRPPLTNMFL